MSREDADAQARLQTTIDRLALELAQERAAHRRTADRLEQAQRRALAWRRVARWLHAAMRGEGD